MQTERTKAMLQCQVIVLQRSVQHSSSESRGEVTASFGDTDDEDTYKQGLKRCFKRTVICMKRCWWNERNHIPPGHQGDNAFVQPKEKYSMVHITEGLQ